MSSLFRPNLITFCICASLSLSAFSSVVRDDVDYQYFRDFAENKGKFTIGASNIAIYDKLNNPIGTMLKDVPMIDLGSIARSGVANLIHPQYIASVWHNRGYENVSFGEAGNNPDAHHFEYVLVDRNDYPKGQGLSEDYHIPRLHKLVTEVSPSAVTSAGEEIATYKNTTRFPMFVRAGSGTQYTRQKGEKIKQVAAPYRYLTGGVPVAVGGRRNHWVDARGWIFGNDHGPLVTYATGGDSGSPLFAYDTQENQWVMVGVLNSNNGDGGNANTFAINRAGYISQKQEEDVGARIEVTTGGENFAWTLDKTSNNSSTLTSDLQSIHVDIFDPNAATAAKHKPRLNHGKNLYFSGETGSLNLAENINQGAGALYFDNDFTVTGNNEDTTWQGAGVSVSENKQVTWKLHNPENDRLSKIGKGTLYVSGKGKNKGDISVGEGTVILDQQANENGEKQAFNQVGIVSGRSTVVLNDAQQVDPDKIYFGFRGGRLDLNGNDLTFKYIQNTDDGARIVNHNLTQTANVTITNPRLLTRNELSVNDRVHANQHFYSWDKADNNPNTYDYFLPKKGTSKPYYPTNQQSNDDWEYLGSDLEKAQDIVLERLNNKKLVYAFNGYFGETDKTKNNGKLNLTFSPETNQHLFFVTGGLELNGDVNVTKGNLLLSGRPTPHAYDHLQGKDVIIDDDWINRSFNATTINVTNDASLLVGRNVSQVNANFTASQNAKLNLGFQQNVTPECVRSDYTGAVKCDVKNLSEQAVNASPISAINGNVQLRGNSQLNLSRATLTGSIQGEHTSNITLHKESQWTLNDNSTIGNLTLSEGSKIQLNHQTTVEHDKFHTLTINGNLSGNGYFHFLTNISTQLGDKVVVNGIASGTHKLFVENSGAEPKKLLTLLEANHAQQDPSKLNISLANPNGVVDLGAFRYQLENRNNHYVLALEHQISKGSGVTTPELPETYFKNGKGVTAELPEAHFENGKSVVAELPEAHFNNGKGVTAELPEAHFKNGKGVTAELPEVHFKNGKGVTAKLPEAHFNNGKGVTAQLPEAHFNNGKGVTAELPEAHFNNGKGVTTQLPEAHFNNGKGVTAELPEAHFKNGKGVTTELPDAHFKNGMGVTAQLPEAHFNNGKGVTAQLPEAHFNNGKGVTTQLPEAHFNNGKGVTAELPEAHFKNGKGVTTELPEAHFNNGKGVTAQLPEAHFNNGKGVTAQLPEAHFNNGKGVTAELPEAHFKNGKGVTTELPEAHFNNGKGVTAQLPEAHFNNGKGVTAQLPEAHFKNGMGVTAQLPEANFKNGKGVTTELSEAHFKNKGVTIEPKPIADLKTILANDNSRPAVKQNRIISRYSNGGLSELSAQVNALLQMNANLHQVMSAKNHHELNVWTKVEQQKTTHSSDNYRAYRQQLNLTQVGLEKGLANQFRLGAVLSNSHTSGDFDDQISQKGRFTQVTVYGKKTWENGIFASLEASYGKARNSLNHQQKSQFSRHIVTTGFTLGTHWDLFNWDVSPTLAVRYHRLSEVNYNFDGANIRINPLNLFTYQAGLNVGRDFKFGSFQLRPELSSQYIDASHNNTHVEVNGHKLHQQFGRYVRNQFGLTLKKSNWELTLSGGLQQGNEVKKQRIASLKFGYNW